MRGRQHRPLVVVAGAVMVLFVGLVGRLGQLQLTDRPGTAALVPGQVGTGTLTHQAARGRILDASGTPLADNETIHTVTITRRALLDQPDGGRAVIERVATTLQRPVADLWDRTFLCGTVGAPAPPRCFNGSAQAPIVLASDVGQQVALTMMEQPESYPGIGIVADIRRRHLASGGVNAAHLLGYVGPTTQDDVARGGLTAQDQVGRAGLEAAYDKDLRGVPGSTTVAIDPRGAVVADLSTTPAQPGRDLVTHLNAPLQVVVEQSLSAAVENARSQGLAADSAAAVVMDVTNGAVVAAASLPTYDPRLWDRGISPKDLAALNDPAANTPLVSRFHQSGIAPASTFKVVSLPAAVNAGVSIDGRYACGSQFAVGGTVFHNFESRNYGAIDLRKVILVSCDTVFYQWAYDSWLAQGGLQAANDDADPFIAMARAYGLGRRSGVDLPGEIAGVVPSRASKLATWKATKEDACRRADAGYPEVAASDPGRAAYLQSVARENCAEGYQYRPGDAINFSIGQGQVTVTPLQLANVYAAVANGGTLWTPQIAAGTRKPDGSDYQPIAAKELGRVPFRPDVLGLLRDSLRGVTSDQWGSARPQFDGFPHDSYPIAGKTGTGEVYGKGATAWFASYGPAHSPKYAVVVMVAQGGSGAKVAAPAARQIWEAIATHGW